MKLMLKWPGLYYMTSAFAPKYYPKAIIDYANTRGADKIMYAGYYPMGLLARAHLHRDARRAVPRPRVAEVPPRERGARVQARPRDMSTGRHRRRALPADLGRHARRRQPRAVPRVPRPRVPRRVRRVAQPLQEPVPVTCTATGATSNWDDERALRGAGDRRHRRRGDLPEHGAAVLPDRRGDRPAARRPRSSSCVCRHPARTTAGSPTSCRVAPERRAGVGADLPQRRRRRRSRRALRQGARPARRRAAARAGPTTATGSRRSTTRCTTRCGPRARTSTSRSRTTRAGLARLRQVLVRDRCSGSRRRRGSRTAR